MLYKGSVNHCLSTAMKTLINLLTYTVVLQLPHTVLMSTVTVLLPSITFLGGQLLYSVLLSTGVHCSLPTTIHNFSSIIAHNSSVNCYYAQVLLSAAITGDFL